MPINATIEYFKAEEKYQNAKTADEKITALEEMIRQLPKHKGTDNLLAQLNARLSKLKKEAAAKRKAKGGRMTGIQKEGEAQVCLVGKTMAGKSLLLSKLTNAKPRLATHPYTTTKPEVGMMNWSGVMIQLVEIPATMEIRFLSIAKNSELVAIVAENIGDIYDIEKKMRDNFIRTKKIIISPKQNTEETKEKIWKALGMMLVYTRKTRTPMALKIENNTVRDFCTRIHKDFIRKFQFASIWRKVNGKERKIQAGLDFRLQEGDIVDVHVK